MLIKEYRICLPMTVEEYRIAQLYMIQKKSREETQGTGSGVEILINEPYENGPGGAGQYTHKVYHIGNHLPGWFRAILPKSALMVEEEAWNAYPYTRTIFKCPFINKLTLFVETRYLNEGGQVENVFNLSPTELRQRTVDHIDIVQDQISSGDYRVEEDPTVFVSEKTGRGPLTKNWRQEYIDTIRGPNPEKKAIMCAYKLCKVEFKYWGMQSKIERFIHDIGLRKTMLRAHRQAWAWQDEYYGLSMADIRQLERQTQEALREKMEAALREEGGGDSLSSSTNQNSVLSNNSAHSPNERTNQDASSLSLDTSKIQTNQSNSRDPKGSQSNVSVVTLTPTSVSLVTDDTVSQSSTPSLRFDDSRSATPTHLPVSSGSPRNRPLSSLGAQNRQSMLHSSLAVDRRGAVQGGSLEMLYSSDEEEFFDAIEEEDEEIEDSPEQIEATYNSGATNKPQLNKSSSLDCLSASGEAPDEADSPLRSDHYATVPASNHENSPPRQPLSRTSVLFLVIHGGSVLESGQETHLSKHTDLSSLKANFMSLITAHYPTLQERVAFKLVSCPFICTNTLQLISSLHPGNFDARPSTLPGEDLSFVTHDHLPVSAIALFATGNPDYSEAVVSTVTRLNQVFADFLASENGLAFNGQVCIVSDSVGSVLAYDALCNYNPYASRQSSYHGSSEALYEPNAAAAPNDPNNGYGPESISPARYHTLIRIVSISNPDLTVTEASPIKAMESSASSTKFTSNASPNRQAVKPSQHAPLQERRSYAPRPKPLGSPFRPVVSCPTSRRTSSGEQGVEDCSYAGSGMETRLTFEVNDLFMFGSPLALVLAYRKLCGSTADSRNASPCPQYLDPFWAMLDKKLTNADKNAFLPRPACQHIYNLFYPADPSAHRLEPLLLEKFQHVAPVKIPRYAKFPLGDGCPVHVVEALQTHIALFRNEPSTPSSPIAESGNSGGGGAEQRVYERRISNLSVSSQWSGKWDQDITSISQLSSRWWGTKRVDYALYSPEGVNSIPLNAVPFLLHSSFWENRDAAAFVLRQVVRQDLVERGDVVGQAGIFTPSKPRERWQRRRTTIKVRNLAPNHRANDIIVLEDRQQVLSAKFMYGPLDVVSLNGEMVDIHIMRNPPSGDWTYHGTEVTDSAGRLTFTLPEERRLTEGMYPVKMVVRGDHTSADLYLTVIPAKTEAVVFSIDGSFTASVSIMGADPKVRPAAVDCVRHWQELGYMLLYVTARPDMQHKKVLAWLAQHNFPHGMVTFMDGLSADPIKEKLKFLRNLKQEADINIRAAYGSAKDLWIYQQLGLEPEQIFIVGKASKKQYKEAIILTNGYASHLEDLLASGHVRAATGNARFFLRKSCFSLPEHHKIKSSKKLAVRKTLSMPGHNQGSGKGGSVRSGSSGVTVVNASGGVMGGASQAALGQNTVLDPLYAKQTAAKPRGNSPRPKITVTSGSDSRA